MPTKVNTGYRKTLTWGNFLGFILSSRIIDDRNIPQLKVFLRFLSLEKHISCTKNTPNTLVLSKPKEK